MASDRPNAENVVFDFLDDAIPDDEGWEFVEGLNLSEGLIVALREAVNAGPDDAFVGLPDGTLDRLTPAEWSLVLWSRDP